VCSALFSSILQQTSTISRDNYRYSKAQNTAKRCTCFLA
jgi:hypothetical protein